MSRQPKDEWMAKLVAGTAGLRFDGAARSRFDELYSAGASFKNCYLSILGWQCKQFLAGEQRILGRFANADAYHAVRFADCIIAHFWRYRKTDREPVDSDFTFSYALAKSTLAGNLPARGAVEHLESWLQQNYQLKPYQKSWHKFDRPKTLKLFAQTWKEFEILAKRLRALTPDTIMTKTNLTILKERVEELSGVVRTIETVVAQMDGNSNDYMPATPVSRIVEPPKVVTAITGEPTTPTIGEPTTAAIGVPLGDVIPTHTQRGDDMFQK